MSKNYAHGRVAPTCLTVSQNFLTSSRTIRRLLRLTTLCSDDLVLEIGFGKGHITRELAHVCREVRAYELDAGLYERTRGNLSGIPNIRWILWDFLKAPLPQAEPYKVFSNPPFSLTTALVRKLNAAKNPPMEAWLVLEKGAAKRFMGLPRESAASLLLKPFYNLEIQYYFSRQDFHPMPSVDTVLLHLTRKAQPDISRGEESRYASFIRASLQYGVQRNLTRRQIATALRLAGLPPIEPSATMLYVQWLCLFRCSRRK